MTDIVKGMAKAYHEAYWNWMPTLPRSMEDEAIRGALLWLADNVSDDMEDAAGAENWDYEPKSAIAAAIRAAAGGGE